MGKRKVNRITEEELTYMRSHPLESIGHDHVVCLECGMKAKIVNRTHLKQQHGMVKSRYLIKWKLPRGTSLMCGELVKRQKLLQLSTHPTFVPVTAQQIEHMLASGMKVNEIATKLGISRATVWRKRKNLHGNRADKWNCARLPKLHQERFSDLKEFLTHERFPWFDVPAAWIWGMANQTFRDTRRKQCGMARWTLFLEGVAALCEFRATQPLNSSRDKVARFVGRAMDRMIRSYGHKLEKPISHCLAPWDNEKDDGTFEQNIQVFSVSPLDQVVLLESESRQNEKDPIEVFIDEIMDILKMHGNLLMMREKTGASKDKALKRYRKLLQIFADGISDPEEVMEHLFRMGRSRTNRKHTGLAADVDLQKKIFNTMMKTLREILSEDPEFQRRFTSFFIELEIRKPLKKAPGPVFGDMSWMQAA